MRVQSVTKLLGTARHNSLERWGGAGFLTSYSEASSRERQSFYISHTFYTDKELLTIKNARDDYVILRHVQPPLYWF